MAEKMHAFPEGFLFGTATSATQVEGRCTTTDWYAFAREGRVKNGDTLDLACDFWRRAEEDVAIQKRLGLNAARLSIEWGRVEPQDGVIDRAALDRYRAILGAHVDAGIAPMVTVHHFTLPRWIAARGGLLAREFPERLARFARLAVDALGDLATTWITINEPNVLAAHAHLLGAWPPAQRDPRAAIVAHRRLLDAHERMYRAMHEARAGLAIGVAHHLRITEPADPSRLADRVAARLFARAFNDPFAAAVCRGRTQDFLGVNYYSRDRVRFDPTRPGELFVHRGVAPGSETSDLGWEIHPDGLLDVMIEWSRRSGGIPVYVTENGIADARDAKRPRFLVRHLARVARAIARGIDVRGYYHWSLMDNFEWAEGYAPRFGLVAIDYATLARTVRPSGELYGRIARAGAIDDATWARWGDGARDERVSAPCTSPSA